MSPDPIKDIEDRVAWISFGRQAALLYKGALEEGLSREDALLSTSAFIKGMFAANYDENREDDSSTGTKPDARED